MTSDFNPPKYEELAFNCPHCRAYSQQNWKGVQTRNKSSARFLISNIDNFSTPNLDIAYCTKCKLFSIWLDSRMIFPDSIEVPPPNPDLDDDIKKDYNEAASILSKSPRGSAALLRLVIQKLCKQLGEPGNDLNDDIGNLAKKGLPDQIQQALDVVRVIGNKAVHPGQIDLRDNNEITSKMFELVNFIAEKMITEPETIDKLFNSLPNDKLEGIKKRDN